MKRAGLTLSLAALLATQSACWLKRKAPPQPSAPTVTAPPLQMPPPPKIQPRPIEEPPLPPPPMPAPPEQEPSVITPSVIKLPPPPKPVRKRSNRTAAKPKPADSKPAETPATTPSEPAAQPPQPAPVLEEVIPGDETRRLRQNLADHQAIAREALAALKGRRLTREQNETAARIRAFLRQAAETENRDIAAAAELARRAALLAVDLRKSLD